MHASNAEVAVPSIGTARRARPGAASPSARGRRAAALTAAIAAAVTGAALLARGNQQPVVAPAAALPPVAAPAPATRSADALPPEAFAAVSRVVGAAERRYWIASGADGLVATAAGLRTTFTGTGAVVRTGGYTTTFALVALHRGAVATTLPVVAPRASRNRVTYTRPGVSEWFANGPAGLEQGMRLARRPLATGAGPLELVLAGAGGLRPVLDASRNGLTLQTADGGAVLRYAGLSVRDAAGTAVPAHLAVRGDRALIVVDDAAARYPLVVDPFVQSAQLTAEGGISGQYVGEAVAVSADGATVVVSGPNQGSGTDYIFERPATGWADLNHGGGVTAPERHTTDAALAVAVSANGDTVVMGYSTGFAYVYNRPVGGWMNQYLDVPNATLTPSSGAGGTFFGDAVGISGDTIIVGSRNDSAGGETWQGAVYVFVKPAGGWKDATETARLTASDGANNDRLGASAAIDGDTIVASSSRGATGTVYVFVKPAGGWKNGTQAAELTVPVGPSIYLGDGLQGLAIHGDTVIAAASHADVGMVSAQGIVFVFVRPAGGWHDLTAETARLAQSDPAANDYLGRSVAFDGTTVVAGALKVGASGQQGAAYLWVKPAGGWKNATETQKLVAADGAPGDSFGRSVGIGAHTIAVGAEFASAVTKGDDIGKAYVFSTPLDPGALGCTSAKVVLINVFERGSKVVLTGAARSALAGQPISIVFLATGKTVAKGKVGAGGLFSFTVPLPPAKVRSTNKARYQAVLGASRSLPLKLERRADMLQAKIVGANVVLKGRVTGKFKAGVPVVFTLRATCGAPFKTVAKGKLSRTGTFAATVPAPAGGAGSIAVFRATTKVLVGRHLQTTFTLPLPPS